MFPLHGVVLPIFLDATRRSFNVSGQGLSGGSDWDTLDGSLTDTVRNDGRFFRQLGTDLPAIVHLREWERKADELTAEQTSRNRGGRMHQYRSGSRGVEGSLRFVAAESEFYPKGSMFDSRAGDSSIAFRIRSVQPLGRVRRRRKVKRIDRYDSPVDSFRPIQFPAARAIVEMSIDRRGLAIGVTTTLRKESRGRLCPAHHRRLGNACTARGWAFAAVERDDTP